MNCPTAFTYKNKKCKLIADQIILEKKGVVDSEFEKGQKLHVIGESVFDLDRFTQSNIVTDQRSTYKSDATPIEDVSEASIAQASLYQELCVAKATQRIYCYSFDGQQGLRDDGKFFARSKLVAALNEIAEDNYVVCYSALWWYKLR